MKKVSNEFINLSKKIKTQDLKLTINDGELTVQEVHLLPINMFNAMPVSLLKARKKVIAKELKYSFEGQLFKTIMQQVEITVKNASEIKGKNVHFQYGIQVNNKFEYVDMGEYYIKDVEDDKNKKELVVTGYDKMLNFMIPFKQSDLQLTYPCKMSRLVNRIGEVCGVELYSTDFYNSELIVEEDFFTIQELTYRDVLEKVAQTTLTTIFIKENKLYLCKEGDSVQTLDTSFLSNLIIGEKFGPVNALVLGRGSVEDNIEAINLNSINENGRCEIRFDENEFVDNKREQVVDQMLQQISGLEYYAVEASNLGLLWLEPCDVIIVKDREENGYKSIYLRASVTINTGIKGEMESNIPETTNTEYKVTTKEEKKTLKVERLAKKNQGLIQDIIEQNTENSQKLTKVEQNVNSINLTVQDFTDFTREKKQIENIFIEDIAEGEGYMLKFVVYGNTNYFDTRQIKICVNTKPRGFGENIYLTTENGEDLLTEGGQRFIIGSNSYCIASKEIQLNDILRSLNINGEMYYDTLEILQDGTIQVRRKIGVNNKKDLYLLSNEVIEQLDEKFILPSLKNGVYYFIEECSNLSYYANYITKNKYSETFLSKLELGTKLEQNAEHIRVAWNHISQFLQMEGIDGKATLNIYDKNNNMLMSLSQDGQTFYDTSGNKIGTVGIVREENKDTLAFAMNVDWNNVTESKSMAWGFFDKNGKFLPIFHLLGYYGQENSEYGGQLIVEGELEVNELKLINILNFEQHLGGITWGNNNNKYILPVTNASSNGSEEWLTYKVPYGHEFLCGDNAIFSMNNNNIYPKKPFYIPYSNDGGHEGFPMIGIEASHKHYCSYDGTYTHFFVDGLYTEVISDKRLKKEIKQVDDKFLDAINELEIKQFKADNRNGLISFGILAQDLIKSFKKYNINPENYEILGKIQYKLDDNTQYYTIEYTQFLVLKQLASDRRIKKLEKKDKQKDEIIQNLIKRIEKLEEENSNGNKDK